jgi:DNA-directed RNA polymerase subunit RPC12/RpoP
MSSSTLEADLLSGFQCRLCLKEYSSKGNLKAHLTNVHRYMLKQPAAGARQFACAECDHKFEQQADLLQHSNVIHNVDLGATNSTTVSVSSGAPTVLSPTSTTTKRVVRSIPSSQRQRQSFICSSEGCRMFFFTKSNLTRHINTMHPSEDMSCDRCGKTYETRARLQRHLADVHDIPWTLPPSVALPVTCRVGTCRESFADHSALKQHVKDVHKPTRFACARCTARFPYRSHLKRHMAEQHSGNAYQCQQCEQSFNQFSLLATHISAAHAPLAANRGYVCSPCGLTIATLDAYLKHNQEHHQSNESNDNDTSSKKRKI